ncbi:GNAT family N-acetyltransferase [Roseomonas sp. BN140053]|uniref:GNAT family N-acetyltransferase n=1 Tax=Roseomonas sp. BN140053 TaxID=3391898 RepID=UPI0039EBF2A6
MGVSAATALPALRCRLIEAEALTAADIAGVETDIVPVRCFAALAEAWRALEEDAAPSFFQSWTWVGCLAEERYPDPVLLRATAGERLVGLALFNRRRGRLSLAENGHPGLDTPFIEHNGPLVAGHPSVVRRSLLRAAWQVRGMRRLRLSGVPAEVLRAAGGMPLRLQQRPVPVVDLDAVRAAGGDYLGTLSANTRQQIRRSNRFYAARGPITVARAATAAEATDWLGALMDLHGAKWQRRGLAGAFAAPFPHRFHHALVLRAQAREELDLLRVRAGEEVVGYLYNFRHRGRVYAYQSGLAPVAAGSPAKPGLTSHALAIARALAGGERVYDFLAGDQRYKRSLANGSEALWWAELVPNWSMLGLAARLRGSAAYLGSADHSAFPAAGTHRGAGEAGPPQFGTKAAPLP